MNEKCITDVPQQATVMVSPQHNVSDTPNVLIHEISKTTKRHDKIGNPLLIRRQGPVAKTK